MQEKLKKVSSWNNNTPICDNNYIDLHMHSYYSDGSLSPTKLVEYMYNQGIRVMALTDHDGTEGVDEAQKAGEACGMMVIPGIEFSSELDSGIGMHILGYGIDNSYSKLQDRLSEIREHRQTRNEIMLSELNNMGYKITEDDLQLRPGQTFVGKPIFAKALCSKGYIDNPKDAFESGKFLQSENIKRIHKVKIDACEAVELICEAGGVAVLAHPALIDGIGERDSDEFYGNMNRILDILIAHGLKGIECQYPKYSCAEEQMFRKTAIARGLVMTRGSDFHGKEFQ